MNKIRVKGNLIAFSILSLSMILSCSEEEVSKTYFFNLGGKNYAIDYTDCKEQGGNFLVLTYRRSPTTPTDYNCELNFYGYVNEPPAGEYQIRGVSNNDTQGYVDVLYRGGDLGLLYLGQEGVVTVKKVNGKNEYAFIGVNFSATGGIVKSGRAELKCF
jgi:hypothetical protein